MNLKAVTVLVVAVVILVGLGATGLIGDSPDRDVGLANEEDLKTGVSPDERPTVKANVTGEGVERVDIAYAVYDRSGEVVDESTEPMERSDGQYTYRLPGYPAGYALEYEVRARYGDDETRTASSSLSYGELVSGPNDGETVSEKRSEVTVELAAPEVVQSVEVRSVRELPERGETVTNATVRRSVDSETVTLPIYNEETGEAITRADVEYTVTVTYSGQGEEASYRSRTFEYAYSSDREDVLVVPVTYETNTSRVADVTNSEVDANATRAMWYFENESNGEFSPTYEWLTNSSSEEYFVLDGNPDQYVGDHSYTRRLPGAGSTSEYKIVRTHDRSRIHCAAAGEVKERYDDFEFGRYDAVVFVQTDVEGTIEYVRNDGDGNETYDRDAKTVRAVNLAEWSSTTCENVATTGSHVVLSTEDNYATYDHELGHAIFGWGDYYGTTDGKRGIVGFWGLMGSGNNREEYPAQIMASHKFQQDWIERANVEPLDRGESRTVHLPYYGDGSASDYDSANDSDSANHSQPRAAVYAIGASPSIFSTYVFEARDPPERDHRPYRGWGPETSGPGLVAYGAETGRSVNVVWNDEPTSDWERTHPAEPTIYARNDDRTVHDPDAGVQFTLEDAPGRSVGDGVVLNLTNPDYRNLEGVNVHYRVDCENVARHCDVSGTASNDTTPLVGLMAYTDRGRVGVTANGSVVNEVSGAHVLPAGTTHKVYVPSNVTARFEIDATDVHEDATVDLRTQTVTRDSNGRRIASAIENDTVEAGETSQPELARLNLSKRSWDAGQVRTLDGNRTTLAVSNPGLESLNGVTVETDSPWASVNWTERETLAHGESATLGVEFEVPGGTPVGNYTFDVTVSGEGVETRQTETMRVTVEVLPTAYWNATPANVTRILEGDDSTQVEVSLWNSPDSNVPLYGVEGTVSGSVTEFDVDAPRFVESVEPGEEVVLTTTVSVPDGGIEEGVYPGRIDVNPMLRPQQSFDYPIAVPEDYVVVEPRGHATNVTIEAYATNTNSSARRFPDERGPASTDSTAERVARDPTGVERERLGVVLAPRL